MGKNQEKITEKKNCEQAREKKTRTEISRKSKNYGREN